MANLMLAIDPDESRRRTFVDKVLGTIAPFEGLLTGSRDGTGCTAVWAVSPSAPLDVSCDENGLCVLLGEAIDEDGRRRTAQEVRSAWNEAPATCWDGFYMAVSAGPGEELVAGVDLLGLFPLYHWQRDGVTLVATSPELFRSHPAFAASFDLEGFVGVMLVNGFVGGRTLWTEVRRLQPGHHLRVLAGRRSEIEAYRIPDTLDLAHLPLEGHVAVLGETLLAAVKRHAPPGPRYGLLLSGGLDSRMIGGLLGTAGVTPRALSIGLAEDLEMRCAKAAAKALGLEQTTAEPRPEDYPLYARLHADVEHLANGFNTIRDWWTQGQVGRLGERIATGIVADAMVGGTAIHWAYTPSPPTMSFDGYWRNMPQMGMSPEVARDLLLPEHKGLVDATMRSLRTEYEGYGDLGSYQAWRFDIAHGERFHVGATLWRLAFGAWPTLPMLDRRVVKVASGIPASSLAHRATQLDLVRTFLPSLGRVPLDRSDLLRHEAQFLEPSLGDLAGERLRKEIGRVRRKITRRETRYWYRVNDFHSEAWKSVRRVVESHRERSSPYFDRAYLDSILPPPDGVHTHISESARKLLVGFLHWSSNHL